MVCAEADGAASAPVYGMMGVSKSGSSSLGCAWVAGRSRVPKAAARITALRTLIALALRCSVSSRAYSI